MDEHEARPALFGAEFDREPSTAYAWLREHSPVHRLELPGGAWAWLLTRYHDATGALADPRLAKAPEKGCPQWQSAGLGLPFDHRPALARSMVNCDPPDHGRLRRAVAAAFTPRRMEALRARVQELTTEALDELPESGHADLVDILAYPVPIAVICDLLGVPAAERDELRRWAMVIDSAAADAVEEVRQATDALEALTHRVVAAKQHNPGEDVISDLLEQHRAGNLTADEVTSTAFLLVIGGHETTVSLIGSALLMLLTHPEQADAARENPALLSSVIEETLRCHSPLRNATWRFATEEMEIAGQLLAPGDPVLISLLAANRDPDAFPAPDSFTPGSHTARHIAFGLGAHSCLGAALARMEGEVVLDSVLRRFPALQLAVPPNELTWWPSPIMRGLFTLPVRW